MAISAATLLMSVSEGSKDAEGSFSAGECPPSARAAASIMGSVTRRALEATRQTRSPDKLVQDAVLRYIEDETRFVEAVKPGEEPLQQGEYLTREQRSNP
jgi:predicted transcriptional regulator